MNCEIICVGTELLLGDILNTNAQYLSRELAALGIGMHRQQVVGDNPERMREAMAQALSRSDLIILSGGLGPTADDLTKEICCEVMGEELVFDEEILQGIRKYFEAKNLVMPENNSKQAYVPKKNGIIFANANGTAPGCAVEKNGKIAIMLPGPPRELIPMFENAVRPYLAEKTGGVILSKQVRTFGIGESDMAQRVADLLDGENPTVAPYAKDGEAFLRVTARAGTQEKAAEMCDETIERIKAKIGGYIYGVDCASLEEKAVELLKKAGKTVALAESCTGGYIAKRITDISGASSVFEYGIVSYSNDVKMKLLGVKPETIEKFTEVSEQAAAEMAQGVRKLSGADFAISVTGFAGPNPADDGRPAGLAYIGFSCEEKTQVREIRTGKNSREYNRYVAASNALHMLIEYMNERNDNK